MGLQNQSGAEENAMARIKCIEEAGAEEERLTKREVCAGKG